MRKLGIALIIAAAAFTSGCFKNELTPEERAAVDALRAELVTSQEELADAKEKDASLSGGLVKALVAVRVEVLSTNTALLHQRINAIESGSPVEQVTQVSAPDAELAKQLEAEISAERAELQTAKVEALRYGGLVGAMKATAVATREQTLAMLQQRYLVAKYGLNPATPKPAQSPQPLTNALPQTPAKPAPKIPAGNGPFGLEAGLSKELIEKMSGQSLVLSDEVQSLYILTAPPKPNDAFEQYALVVSPTVGLCQIRAVGKTIDTNNFGHQLKDRFTTLQASLSAVYGTPLVLDTLMPGSIWKDSRDWMMGLNKKDRSLLAEWAGTPTAPLKSDIEKITMVARAQSSSQGYVMLQYSFKNHKICVDEQDQRVTSSL